jgi:penicillin-binding protein 2
MWTVGRWVNLAIGQGDLLATPLQLIRSYAAIANGGTLVTPHVGMDVKDQNGNLIEKIAPEPEGQLNVDPGYLQETIKGMRMVTATGGTAENAFKGTPLRAVGKSGTGERWGNDPINWFVGWTEDHQDNPLVVVVMVEGGGAFEQGSELTTAPAVRNILETYYGKKPSEDPSKDQQTSSGTVAGRPPNGTATG